MTIKSITITNFRSYYGQNCFDFTDGLTLIIGDNGDGKTTFFEALHWLFDTTPNSSATVDHLSEMRKAEMEVGETTEVSVEMEFDHAGHKSVRKSFYVERASVSKYAVHGGIACVGYETQGAQRQQVDGKQLLNRCFDAFIQRYSMFKGESSLNVLEDQIALRELVDKFSDIREFGAYESMTQTFADKASKAYDKECKNDKKTRNDAEKLSRERENLTAELQNIRRDIRSYQSSSESMASKIETLEQNRETTERYQEIKRTLQARADKAAKLQAQISAENLNINLLDQLWILAPFAPVLQQYKAKVAAASKQKRQLRDEYLRQQGAEEERRKLANGVAMLPWYLPNEETMQEMINDCICKVCGRPAHPGSPEYDFMVRKLEDYRANQLKKDEAAGKKRELFKNRYIEELHNISIAMSGEPDREVTSMPQTIQDKLELIERLKGELKTAQERVQEMEDEKARLLIQADGLTESQLDTDFANIKGYFAQKEKAEKKLSECQVREEFLTERLKEVTDRFRNLNPEGGMAKVFQRMYATLDRIATAFARAKENNLTAFLHSLEDLANDYMTRLNEGDFHGVIRLIRSANDRTAIRIKLMSDNGAEIKNPGGAQQTTMYMSVLFAISELTSNKREEKFPLIFDAPTSSFGEIKEDVFYNIIDKLDKQCIIVTKDLLANGQLDHGKINQLTCSVYRIRKAAGFDQNNLATIRTTITKVK